MSKYRLNGLISDGIKFTAAKFSGPSQGEFVEPGPLAVRDTTHSRVSFILNHIKTEVLVNLG
jgi:hypothetical protein